MFCASLIPSIAVRPSMRRFFVSTLSLHPCYRAKASESDHSISWRILATASTSTVCGSHPERARPTTCRDDFHNAYFEDGVSGTSLTGLVGRVINSVPRLGGRTTAGDRNDRRSDRSNWSMTVAAEDRRLFGCVNHPNEAPKNLGAIKSYRRSVPCALSTQAAPSQGFKLVYWGLDMTACGCPRRRRNCMEWN